MVGAAVVVSRVVSGVGLVDAVGVVSGIMIIVLVLGASVVVVVLGVVL